MKWFRHCSSFQTMIGRLAGAYNPENPLLGFDRASYELKKQFKDMTSANTPRVVPHV